MRHVWLEWGQSNAMGYGKVGTLTPPSFGNVAAESSDSGLTYARPTLANFPCLYQNYNSNPLAAGYGSYLGQHAWESGTAGDSAFGPEISFMWNYKAAHPGVDLAVLKCAVGGTSIAQWSPPGQPFGFVGPSVSGMWDVAAGMVEDLKAHLDGLPEEYRFAGLLWMQGENGASSVGPYLNPSAGNEYSDHVRYMLAELRDITRADLPVLIGVIGDNQNMTPAILGSTHSGTNTPENRRGATLYRRAQQRIVGSDPHTTFVDMDGLPVYAQGADNSQWFHTTEAGYLAMGERFWRAYRAKWMPRSTADTLLLAG